MRTIWKFPLQITDFQKVEMPRGAHILSVQIQGSQLCLWAYVLSDEEKEERAFWVLGTGNPVERPENIGPFIGTVQMHGGSLVWHVFEHHYR